MIKKIAPRARRSQPLDNIYMLSLSIFISAMSEPPCGGKTQNEYFSVFSNCGQIHLENLYCSDFCRFSAKQYSIVVPKTHRREKLVFCKRNEYQTNISIILKNFRLIFLKRWFFSKSELIFITFEGDNLV